MSPAIITGWPLGTVTVTDMFLRKMCFTVLFACTNAFKTFFCFQGDLQQPACNYFSVLQGAHSVFLQESHDSCCQIVTAT